MKWTGKQHEPGTITALSEGQAQTASGAPAAVWALGEEAMAELVDLIPNEPGTGREVWLDVMYGVKGAGCGFEIFDKWASRWDGYDPADTLRVWDTQPAEKVLARGGKLRAMAEEANRDAFVRWRNRWEPLAVFDDVDDMGLLSAGAPAETTITPHHRTVAWAVEQRTGTRMRFNHDSGCWHTFGATWAAQPGSVRSGFNEAWRWVNDNIAGMTPAQIKQVSKADFFSGVETILKQRLAIRHVDFDRDPWLLGTPGGTVDLRTGVLRPAAAGEFISKSTAVTPSATADCPRWKRFITEITKKDVEAATFLQQWAGYCLSGDTTEQVFLFLYGPGGNGKSVLMDTLGRLLGDYFVKPVADLYFAKGGTRHMQEVAMLAGARMVTVSEVPPNAAWDEGKLKDHTGGGRVTANFMRQNSFSFEPQFKLTALGNHKPTFPGGMNAAIKRRFRLMLLDYEPVKADPDLAENLWKERAGILRWCIEGLTDPARGWHAIRLMEPQSMKDATKAYIHDQDIFGLWEEERIEDRMGSNIASSDLFNDWNEFRHANGAPEFFVNQTTFAAEMARRGYRKLKLKANNAYADISLISKAKSVF